jgi:hypothetical protein
MKTKGRNLIGENMINRYQNDDNMNSKDSSKYDSKDGGRASMV